jgi:hypothetical protein
LVGVRSRVSLGRRTTHVGALFGVSRIYLVNYLVWVEFPPRARGKIVKKSINKLN